MCTDDQHRQKMAALRDIHEILIGREPIGATVQISATTPYIIDYKERKHLFIFSATSLTLTLEDLGNFALPSGQWVNMGFSTGTRVYASGQSSNVPLFVKCTDETIA